MSAEPALAFRLGRTFGSTDVDNHNRIHLPFTRFNRGLRFFAPAPARRLLAAKIALALAVDIWPLLAIEEETDLKPGCFEVCLGFTMLLLHRQTYCVKPL